MLFRNGADVANFGKGAQKSANTWYHLRYTVRGVRSLPAPNPAVGPPPGKRRPDAAAGFLARRGRMAVRGCLGVTLPERVEAGGGAGELCTAARRRRPVRRAPPSSAGCLECAVCGCRRCKKRPFGGRALARKRYLCMSAGVSDAEGPECRRNSASARIGRPKNRMP